MTDNLSKYEGHTPGPWRARTLDYKATYTADTFIEPSVAAVWANGPDACLIADAPLLLAEVKRLRERLDGLHCAHGEAGESCGFLEQEDYACASCYGVVKTHRDLLSERVEALRQSHARLLAAAKAAVCSCTTEPKCIAFRAAVAEAEALNGE